MEKHKITKTELKERGWTESIIKRFVPDPDATAPNPYNRHGASTKLYNIDRIERVEQTNEFKEAQDKADRRRKSAKKAVETKEQKLLEEIEGWEIVMECKPLNIVRRDAIRAYNARMPDVPASLDSDQSFLDRITVNYLRHELSSYDAHLGALFGKVGKGDAYHTIRMKVLRKISKSYPDLAPECTRQKN